jgi:hypothetical protein
MHIGAGQRQFEAFQWMDLVKKVVPKCTLGFSIGCGGVVAEGCLRPETMRQPLDQAQVTLCFQAL